MRKKRAAWGLVLLLAGQIMFAAEETKPEKLPQPEKSQLRKVLEKSLLFPGLGQLSEKQYFKAALFGGAEIICLSQVLIFMGKGNNAYKKYRDAKDVAMALEFRKQTGGYDKRRNTAIMAAAGVWVLNMVDIFIFAKKKYGKKASIGFNPYYNHENKTIGVSLRFSPL